MNEHFVTCTVTSLHKLALFFIVLVTALWIQNLLITVFKTINIHPPEYLRDLFRVRDNIKSLRGDNKLQAPKPNTTCYGKNSVKYLAAITWNKISDTLRSVSALSAFKKAVHQLRFFHVIKLFLLLIAISSNFRLYIVNRFLDFPLLPFYYFFLGL